MTNFERLVQIGKTDMEELARAIADNLSCSECMLHDNCNNEYYDCVETWLHWLESEAEE